MNHYDFIVIIINEDSLFFIMNSIKPESVIHQIISNSIEKPGIKSRWTRNFQPADSKVECELTNILDLKPVKCEGQIKLQKKTAEDH